MSQNKIKLYWLHPHFYNWMGGHKYIYEVIIRLKENYDFDVTLITSGMSLEAVKHFQKSQIPVIYLTPFSTNSILYWIFLPFFLFFEKWYLLLIKKIDTIALFISSMFPANTLASSLSSKTFQLCYEPFAFFYDQNFVNGFSFPQKIFIK